VRAFGKACSCSDGRHHRASPLIIERQHIDEVFGISVWRATPYSIGRIASQERRTDRKRKPRPPRGDRAS
jgi:hypothetical protein